MASEEELDHADAVVMERHSTLDATAGYALLAEKVWTALRGLGVESGRMLAFGDHAATLSGVSDPDISTGYQEWVATIPPADQEGPRPFPHQETSLRRYSEADPAVHDVVFASLGYADVHFRSEYGKARLLQMHTKFLINAVAHTLPGGILAAVTSYSVLDDPEPAVRELMRDNTDLIGAIRLPARALRPQLSREDAAPADLLLLRRRIPGEPVHSPFFLDVAPVTVPGGAVLVNEYFSMFYPEHVAGLHDVVADPDRHEGLRYTVEPGALPLDVTLEHTMSNLVARAAAHGLTAASTTWAPIEERPARETDRPVRRDDTQGPELSL
jgi:hypothetical protein